MRIKHLAFRKNLLILLMPALFLALIDPLKANSFPFSPSRPTPTLPPPPSALPKAVSSTQGIVYIGLVRRDNGYLYKFSGSTAKYFGSNVSWDTCPERTKLIGRAFNSSGFWICASSDVADKTYHVGNVLRDKSIYFEVLDRKTKSIGSASWDTCNSGKLRGRVFDSNGFWFCQD